MKEAREICKNPSAPKRRNAKYLRWLIPLLIVFAAVYCVIGYKVFVNRASYSPAESGVIVVLGNALINGELPNPWLVNRLETALALYDTGKYDTIVTTGGKGPNDLIPVAQSMKQWLIGNGVAANVIVAEDNSSDTFENLKYTYALTGDKPVTIVSNDFHMYRAMMMAENFFSHRGGFCYISAPSLQTAAAYAKEPLSVMKYYVLKNVGYLKR